MSAAYDPEFMNQVWSLAQVTAIAAAAGWTAERLLDTGVQTRGLPLLSGLFGLYLGPYLLDLTGWYGGPSLAGHPLAPAFAGALAICAFLKLVSLGAAGPRR